MRTRIRCTLLLLLLNVLASCSHSQVVDFSQNQSDQDEDLPTLDDLDILLARQDVLQQSTSRGNSHTSTRRLQGDDKFVHGLFEASSSVQGHDAIVKTQNNNNNKNNDNISINKKFVPHVLDSSSSSSSSLSLSSTASESSKFLEKEGSKIRDELDALSMGSLFEKDKEDLTPHYRRKRQAQPLVAGSGQSLSRGRLVLTVGPDLTAQQQVDGSAENTAIRNAIGQTISNFVTSAVPNSSPTVQVTSVTPGSINVFFDIVFSSDITFQTLAQAFVTLDNSARLTVDGNVYLVSDPFLNDESEQSQAAICFTCQAFQSCQSDGSTYFFCQTSDSRYFPFGPGSFDSALRKDRPNAFDHIDIRSKFPFNSELVESIFITRNGLISLGTLYQSPLPQSLMSPELQNLKLLAPYWAFLDLANFDVVSDVYYQHYSKPSANSNILNRANDYVTTYIDDVTSFDASDVVVVTWDNVPPFRAVTSLTERVNFQVVIITDGLQTFVVYIYVSGGLNFNAGRERQVAVGYTGHDFGTLASYYTFDSVIGNTNTTGLWVFRVGQSANTRAQCLNWYNENLPQLSTIQGFNQRVPACPCHGFRATQIGFYRRSREQRNCFDTVGRGIGRRCCYNRSGGFVTTIPTRGGLSLFSPYSFMPAERFRNDIEPKTWCCSPSNLDLCPLYYVLRPDRSCFDLNRFHFCESFNCSYPVKPDCGLPSSPPDIYV